MKKTKFDAQSFAIVLLSIFGTACPALAFEDHVVDHITVTDTKWTEADVVHAKHQIALIQTDPGYYYSGAAGAVHRVHDVNVLKHVIEQGERVPASVK